jgi:hypothetical protein
LCEFKIKWVKLRSPMQQNYRASMAVYIIGDKIKIR